MHEKCMFDGVICSKAWLMMFKHFLADVHEGSLLKEADTSTKSLKQHPTT